MAVGAPVATASTGHPPPTPPTPALKGVSSVQTSTGTKTTSRGAQHGSPTTDATVPALASTAHPQVAAERGFRPNAATGSSAPTAPPPTSLVSTSGAAQPTSSVHTDAAPTAAHTALTTTASPVASATVSTPAVNVAPSDPAPSSPIAAILALPGRIANVVLELFGIQEASGTTPTPISPAPLIQLALAAFREIEKITGLDTPVAQP